MPYKAPCHPKGTPTRQALCTLWPDCNGWGCPRGRWSSLPWGCCKAHFGSRESASFWASPCSVWLNYHRDFGNCHIPNEKWYDLQISHAIHCFLKYFFILLIYIFTDLIFTQILSKNIRSFVSIIFRLAWLKNCLVLLNLLVLRFPPF